MVFILLLVAALTLLVAWIKWNYSYWQRKGFPYVEPKIPFGLLASVCRREESMGIAVHKAYSSSREKVLGVYMLTRPMLLVREAQLARDVLAKDFNSFHDRGIYVNAKEEPMSGHLFALEGQDWKEMRTNLAPSFSSGKLKAMFGTIDAIGNEMVKHLNATVAAEGYTRVEIKKLFAIYAKDIIGSSIFGLDLNSFQDPKNTFMTVTKGMNDETLTSVIRGTTQMLYPGLEDFFVRVGWRQEAFGAMKKIVSETIAFRDKNNVVRRDLLQLLLQLRNVGQISSNDNTWAAEVKAGGEKGISVEKITAQMLLFYSAGYETTASTAAFTIYELAQAPDLLARAIEDVENAMRTHETFGYDALKDMTYLDLCIMETIRKYPALPFLNRLCTKDYPIPGTDKVITKGTPILVSLLGLHRDPEYFPEPQRYDPDRFLKENMNYNPVAYMAFGEGPRHCIAQRMGLINVKVAVAKILMNFNVETMAEKREIEFDNFGITLMPKGGVHVGFSKKH